MSGDFSDPAPNDRPILLRDIAALAGVHVSTVSRTLHRANSGLPLRTETARRIRDLAVRLGYVPDPSAVALRTKRTNAIGVLVPTLSDMATVAIYEGVEHAATEHGYQTLVANTHDDLAEQSAGIELMLSRRVAGLVLADAHADGTSLAALQQRGVGFVLVDRPAGDHPAITGDDYYGGRLVGQHLADLGHRRIGIVAGPVWAGNYRDRVRGCFDVLAERGITVPERAMVYAAADAAGGAEAASKLLARRPRPTAIFAVNDCAAIGVMRVARARGLVVGEQLATVGYNDGSLSCELMVPLTTVAPPLHEMGRRAVLALIAALNGGDARSERLTPHLVVRESSDPTVVSGPLPSRRARA